MRSKAPHSMNTFVDFYSKPSLNILEAIGFGFQSVSTEFCCYIGDDDFRRCIIWHVVFFEKTPIMIRTWSFGLRASEPFSNMLLIKIYPLCCSGCGMR